MSTFKFPAAEARALSKARDPKVNDITMWQWIRMQADLGQFETTLVFKTQKQAGAAALELTLKGYEVSELADKKQLLVQW